MRQILRSFVHKTLAVMNVFPTKMTDRNELRALLQKLYPVSCNKELIRLGPKGDGDIWFQTIFKGLKHVSPLELGLYQDLSRIVLIWE